MPEIENKICVFLIHDLSRKALILEKNGKYTLPTAGVRNNEGIEDCVARAVREETKITQLKDIQELKTEIWKTSLAEAKFWFAISLQTKVEVADDRFRFKWIAEDEIDSYEYWHPTIKSALISGFREFLSK